MPKVEIDEYRDYEKALSALREALKYMVKARAQNKEERCKQLQQKIYLVDRFVEARKVVKSDPNEMVKISHQLLEQPDVEQVSSSRCPPSYSPAPPRATSDSAAGCCCCRAGGTHWRRICVASGVLPRRRQHATVIRAYRKNAGAEDNYQPVP